MSGEVAAVETTIMVNFNAHDLVCCHKFALTIYNDKGDSATSLGIAGQIVPQGKPIILAESFSSAQNPDPAVSPVAACARRERGRYVRAIQRGAESDCDICCAPGQPMSTLLTPTNVALPKDLKAKAMA